MITLNTYKLHYRLKNHYLDVITFCTIICIFFDKDIFLEFKLFSSIEIFPIGYNPIFFDSKVILSNSFEGDLTTSYANKLGLIQHSS